MRDDVDDMKRLFIRYRLQKRYSLFCSHPVPNLLRKDPCKEQDRLQRISAHSVTILETRTGDALICTKRSICQKSLPALKTTSVSFSHGTRPHRKRWQLRSALRKWPTRTAKDMLLQRRPFERGHCGLQSLMTLKSRAAADGDLEILADSASRFLHYTTGHRTVVFREMHAVLNTHLERRQYWASIFQVYIEPPPSRELE